MTEWRTFLLPSRGSGFFFFWLLKLLLSCQHVISPTPASSVHRSVCIGGSRIMDCNVNYPIDLQTDHIMTWRKHNMEVPIFIQFNGYPPHIAEKFQGRLRLVEQGSIELSDIRLQDEGWYQCFIVFLNSSDEPGINGTRIYLSVHAPPVLGEVSPSFLIQKVGETVDIFCEATGTPLPELSWLKDENEIHSNDRVNLSGNRLQIKRLARGDAGVYACTFKNIVGQVSHVIKLVIEGNAYIMMPPKNTTTQEGTRVKLNCQAEGSPNNITYQWFHNGDNAERSIGLMTRSSIYADGSFVINKVVKEDNGWYKCQPTNGLGHPPEAKAYLTVTYLPRVLNMPTRIYLPRGMVGKIECKVDANPPVMRIIWSRNGIILDVSGISRIKINQQGILVINPVTTSDEGNYSCKPYSPLGGGEPSLPVQVLVRDPPHFLIRPNLTYQRLENDSVVMPCVADADPTPILSWKKADGVFPSSTKTLVDNGNLTIVKLEKEDYGTYECIATNVVTSVIATTLLIIENTTPHAPYNLTVETTSASANLMWLPAYDGGSPQHYILWYRIQGLGSQSNWETIRILPDGATSVTVYNLVPDTLYQFMVLSRNHLGDGLFSKPIAASTQGSDPADGIKPVSGKVTKSWSQPTSPLTSVTYSTQRSPGHSGLHAPTGLMVHQSRAGLNITWQRPRMSSGTSFEYLIQYRTIGQWVTLVQGLLPNVTSHLWKTSSRGTTYSFRIVTYNQDTYSNSSQVVTINTGPGEYSLSHSSVPSSVIGSLIGLVITVLTAVIIVTASYKYFIKKKRREKSARYGNIKYFGPNQVEDNHINTTIPDALEQTCDSRDFMVATIADNQMNADSEYFEKAMKETPI